MLYLFSRAPSTPRPELVRIEMSGVGVSESACKNPHPIPEGLEIPESWRDMHDDSWCGTPRWAPRFSDDADVESRLGKDIEDFSPEEYEHFKKMEGFGRQRPPELEGFYEYEFGG